MYHKNILEAQWKIKRQIKNLTFNTQLVTVNVNLLVITLSMLFLYMRYVHQIKIIFI